MEVFEGKKRKKGNERMKIEKNIRRRKKEGRGREKEKEELGINEYEKIKKGEE